MKNVIFGLIALIILSGCINSSEKDDQESVQKLSYLALGDSYTIGESVEPELRWPVQLVDSLREQGVQVDYPVIIAQTGWTTQDLLTAMDQKLQEERFDLVSVLIGVNNQYQGKSIEEYEADLHKVFEQAIAHSKTGNSGVFVVSIPDYGATPFGASRSEEIGEEIEKFNLVFERVATEFQLEFYDITPISKDALEDESLVASDELHPSGKMYSQWVEEFIDEVIKKITSEI